MRTTGVAMVAALLVATAAGQDAGKLDKLGMVEFRGNTAWVYCQPAVKEAGFVFSGWDYNPVMTRLLVTVEYKGKGPYKGKLIEAGFHDKDDIRLGGRNPLFELSRMAPGEKLKLAILVNSPDQCRAVKLAISAD